MRYRLFAQTGLYVSELCLGTMTFGGKGFWTAIGKLSAAEAEAMIGAALDAGVNFIDTADGYSEGESEKLVGAALAWLLTRPFVTSVIIGAKTPEQLADNLGASDVTLDAEHVAQLDAASATAQEYPAWMVERQNQNRRPTTAV